MNPEKEFDIKWSAASLYSGGADTVRVPFLNVSLFQTVARLADANLRYARLSLRFMLSSKQWHYILK